MADWDPTDLLAHTMRTLVDRSGVGETSLADVIPGCVLQMCEQAGNISRWAILGAGLPEELPANHDRPAVLGRAGGALHRPGSAQRDTTTRSASAWSR